MKAKGLIVLFRPAGFEQVPESIRDRDSYFVPQRVSIISIFGRTDMIAPADMPKTWTDLIDPKYKGKLVLTNPNFTHCRLPSSP